MKNLKGTKKKLFGIIIIVFALITIGCENNTTQPDNNELKLSDAAQNGLVSGWQSIHSINSSKSITGVVSSDPLVENEDVEGLNTKSDLKQECVKLKENLKSMLKENSNKMLSKGDSLIWFIDITNPVSGISVRKGLIYNSATGMARYYETFYQYPSHMKLKYDSIEIKADLNFTLSDDSDDKIISLYKLSEFKDGFAIVKNESIAQITEYDENNEVSGAQLSNTVWYGEQSKLEKLTQQLVLNSDESGSIYEKLDYRDGTFLEKQINFYDDYTGDFSESWRNGTTVNGNFDRIEDDNHAAFLKTVNYPSGRYLEKLQQSADITLNPVDSTINLILSESRHFSSGRLDSTRLEIDEYYEGDIKTTHLQTWNSDGSHADLTVSQYDTYEKVIGNYTGPLGYFTTIEATNYSDGSGELNLKVYQSEEAFNNGESPLVIIYIQYNPDRSGNGEITENNKKYNVTVDSDGKMEVSDDKGLSTSVNGF